MKAIIYAGVGLLTAASVYGVVNYSHAKKAGAFNHLYKDEDTVVAKKIEAKPEATKSNIVVNPDSAVVVKKIKKRPQINLEDFSRGRIDYVKNAGLRLLKTVNM